MEGRGTCRDAHGDVHGEWHQADRRCMARGGGGGTGRLGGELATGAIFKVL